MAITAIPAGKKRSWVRCKECGYIGYYDYVPYSIANPMRWLPCGHGIGQRFDETVDFITADEAIVEIQNQE